MSTQNSLVIIKEKIAGVMLDDKRMKADDIAKKVLKGRKRECSTPPNRMHFILQRQSQRMDYAIM